MSSKYPRLLRRWRRPLRLPSAASHNDAQQDVHAVRVLRLAGSSAGHLDTAMSEVHAARVAMRNALLELDQALTEGERLDPPSRRLIDAEVSGTREEAAMLTALLVTAGREEYTARPVARELTAPPR
jgi:hypothetical protein